MRDDITTEQLAALMPFIHMTQRAKRSLAKAVSHLLLAQHHFQSVSFKGDASGAVCTTTASAVRAEVTAMLEAIEPFLG